MSIYGYNRQTTPHFDNLKNELFAFKNVNTAHAFTSGAVKSMFQINLDKSNNQQYTLIHFFKDAGFKTFWFSNQGRFNIFDNYVMRFGKLCDEYAFIIWVSDQYKKQNATFIKTWDIETPYVTDKTAYTIIDLARMKHSSIDLSKSIFLKQNNKSANNGLSPYKPSISKIRSLLP